MAIEIQIEEQDEIRILGLSGRLDTETAADVELAFADLLATGATSFVVDLSGIGYVSSAGLRVLLALAKKLDGGKGHLYLCGLSPAVRQVFDVAGFSKLFALFPDRDAALKKAGKAAPVKPKPEAAPVPADTAKADAAKAEAAKVEAAKLEAAKIDAAKIAAAKAEADKRETAAAAQAQAAKAEAEQLATAKDEAAKLEATKASVEKAEAAKADAAKAEAAKAAADKLAVARTEAAKADATKLELAKLEAAKAEAARREAGKLEAARAAAAKAEAAKVQAAKVEAAGAEAARIEAARIEAAKAEAQRVEAAQALKPENVLAQQVTKLLGLAATPETPDPKVAMLARSAALLLGLGTGRSEQATKPPRGRATPANAAPVAASPQSSAPAAVGWKDKMRGLFGGKR
ncbi:MAG: STAS domain-containing protein [Rudaea sp.]